MGTKEAKKTDKGRSFLVRFISAAVLIGIAFAAIIPGGVPLIIVNYIIALIGTMEVCRLVKTHKTVLGVTAYASVTALYTLIFIDQDKFLLPLIMFTLLLMFVFMVGFYPQFKPEQLFISFGAVIYVALGLSYLYRTRMLPDFGKYLVWLIFIGSSVSDTGAYLVGMLLGRHKAFPKLSPKKSIEGCLGGVAFTVLFGLGYYFFLSYKLHVDFLYIWQVVVISIFASVCAQIGDLAASAIKRFFDVKDYGRLIPGHGGIMDRFDSIIFVSPLVYYLSVCLFKF